MSLSRVGLFLPLLLSVVCLAPCQAQDASIEEDPLLANEPTNELQWGTPRSSAIGFLRASSETDFETAARFLDLRNLPDSVEAIGGEELARQLYHVLSRAVWLDDYRLSDDPDGSLGDGLPGYRDELVVIEARGREYPLWMQRVPREDGTRIWKVSNRSVALIPELYRAFSYPRPVEHIRNWFPKDAYFLGLEAFKWFIALVAIGVAWPLFWMIGWLLSRLVSAPKKSTYPLVRKVFSGPFILIGTAFFISTILRELGVGPQVQKAMDANTLVTVAVVWAGWAIINLIREFKVDRLVSQGRPGAAKLLQPISTLGKLLILLIGLLYWLNNIGVSITAVLAGLGVGGLAIALALQKPIEDLMGAFSIFSHSTVRVGDFCRHGELTGVVEEIGLRMTQIRTLDNTLVAVPNSRIAYAEVENYTARRKIRFCPTLRLRYDSTPAQLRSVADGVLALLQADARVRDELLFSRLLEFDEDAFLIKVHSYIDTSSYLEFLEISEELNYRIVEIVQASGTGFALPSHALYMQAGQPPVVPADTP
jgi:MscS family membrane protein